MEFRTCRTGSLSDLAVQLYVLNLFSGIWRVLSFGRDAIRMGTEKSRAIEKCSDVRVRLRGEREMPVNPARFPAAFLSLFFRARTLCECECVAGYLSLPLSLSLWIRTDQLSLQRGPKFITLFFLLIGCSVARTTTKIGRQR